MKNINEEYYYTVYSNDEIIVKNMKFFEMVKLIINNNIFFDRITYTFSKKSYDKDFFIGNRNEFIGTILNDNVLDKQDLLIFSILLLFPTVLLIKELLLDKKGYYGDTFLQ